MSGRSRTVRLGEPEPRLLSRPQAVAAWILVGACLALVIGFVVAVLIGVVALYRWAL